VLGKRLYKKFWWGIESIVLKLLSGVSTFLIGPIAAEKSAIQFLTHKKRQILYKKSSRKTTLHDIYISRNSNSWPTFEEEKRQILLVKFQMRISQRVFIPCRASKYMLDTKCGTFGKQTNFCHFWFI